MSKFVSGNELLAQGIRDFELLSYVRKGLQPYSDLGEPIPSPDIEAKQSELAWLKEQLEGDEKYLESSFYKVQEAFTESEPKKITKLDLAKSGAAPSLVGRLKHAEKARDYRWQRRFPQDFKDAVEKRQARRDALESEISAEGYSWKNYQLPDPELEARRVLLLLVNSLYRKEDIRKHIKDLIGDEWTSAANLGGEETASILPLRSEAKWSDVWITLVANNMVRIKTPQGNDRLTYHELGMVDRRSGDRPTMIWELMKLFAEHSGFIASHNIKYDPKLPDTARRLNKHLQKLFGIRDSIYTGHYKKEKGYRTKIRFDDLRATASSKVEHGLTEEIEEEFREVQDKSPES
jgi:hypothetical protein